MAQQSPTVEYRKVVIDCHSVGYAASELQPSGVEDSFRIRNIALCVLSLMKIYFLTAFDFNVFSRYDSENQKKMLKKVAQIFTSPSTMGKECLKSAKITLIANESLADNVIKDACKEVQKTIMRQDVHFDFQLKDTCASLWASAGLPPIVLCLNIDKEATAALMSKKNFFSDARLLKLLYPSIYDQIPDEKQLQVENVLVISNNVNPYANIIDEGLCEVLRVPFAITKDSAYFYVPKDPLGRNEDTLMQNLIGNTDLRLSMEYEKAWKLKSFEHEVKLRNIRDEIQQWKNELKPVPANQKYKFLLVLDFEATCVGVKNPDGYAHEIIEFPLILFDMTSGKVTDQFHSFCRPRINSRLSEFCQNFTGIQQSDVDSASPFPDVLSEVEKWLTEHDELDTHGYALAVDCEADVAKYLRLQCQHDHVPVPTWAEKWINLQVAFQGHYKLASKLKLTDMLAVHELKFNGRQHCGLDDAKNSVRVAQQLVADGCRLLINQRLDSNAKNHHSSVDEDEAGAKEPY